MFFTGVPVLDMVELKTYDLRFLSRGIEEPAPEVVMAILDEKSPDMEGRWPWPRSKIARLIDLLSLDGAKVIGLDIELFRTFAAGERDFYKADLCIRRSMNLKSNPPPPDWDGVFIMTMK